MKIDLKYSFNFRGLTQFYEGKKIKQLFLFLILSVFMSCEEFVEVELPPSQLTGAAVFDDATTASAALSDIYAQLRETSILTGSPYGITNLLGNYADELVYFNSHGLGEVEFFNNSLLPTNPAVTSFWNSSYNLIYAANSVVEGVENSVSLVADEKDQLKGEALFLRGLLHFYLVNLYGEIPYVSTIDYRLNMKVSREPVEIIYQKIIEDLSSAKALLYEEYVTSERVRPNKWVASALLARTYLYTENWEMAEAEASSVINSGLYHLEEDLSRVFKKDSNSTLWQFMPSQTESNTKEAHTFIFISVPPPNSALRQDLVEAFSQDDLRKTNWMGSVTDGVEEWYYPFKYKLKSNSETSEEYSILFRLAEMYLIRAEALAELGDLPGALNDLNKIRNRAGLPNSLSSTQADILEEILSERRKEFLLNWDIGGLI